MKIRIILITLILTTFYVASYGQNLIPNPGFEESDNCPLYISSIWASSDPYVTNWYKPTYATPDYYHSCVEWPFSDRIDVPVNQMSANQPAHSGSAYTGLYISSNNTNYREYIQASLTDSLEAGEYYYFECWLAPATRDTEEEEPKVLTSDDIGVNFYQYKVTEDLEVDTIDLLASVDNIVGNNILNAGIWTLMHGFYIATGGEKWITVGNFKSELNTSKMEIPGYGFGADGEEMIYFFVDDLKLIHFPEKYLPDTTLCVGEILEWNINLGEGDYLWNSGDTTRTISISESGIYWLQYIDGTDTLIDSSVVIFLEETLYTSSTDLTICFNELPYILQANEEHDDFIWNNGVYADWINITEEGTYWVKSHYNCNLHIDTFNITIIPDLPKYDDFIINDTLMCSENWVYYIEGPDGFSEFYWSNGDTTQHTIFTEPGLKSVTYSLPCYWFIEYFTISEDLSAPILIDLGPDSDKCDWTSNSITIDAGILPNYLWSSGETTRYLTISDTGTYSVSTTTSCGTWSDTIHISDCNLLSGELIFYPVPSFGVVHLKTKDELAIENIVMEIYSLQGLIDRFYFSLYGIKTFDFTYYMKAAYRIKIMANGDVYWFDMVLL